MNIVLVGIKHAGKSTLGALIAEERQSLFIDSDELIEANYHLKNGEKLNCREIFNLVGREAFRHLEAEALLQLQESSNEDDQERIISVGGGVADNPYISIDLLKSIGTIVFIDTSIDLAWERVIASGIPAYLSNEKEPKEVFYLMSEERITYYRANADLIIELKNDDREYNLELVEKKLKGYL